MFYRGSNSVVYRSKKKWGKRRGGINGGKGVERREGKREEEKGAGEGEDGGEGKGESDLCWKFLGGITGVLNANLYCFCTCMCV